MRYKPYLDVYDKAILHFLLVVGGWHSANRIANRVAPKRISWNTADAHLEKLWKWGYVKKSRGGLWAINR